SFEGPSGTKLGSFIINDQLEIKNEYCTVVQYDIHLKNSIDIGLVWLRKNISHLNDPKYESVLTSIESHFIKKGYTDALNQRILELSHDVLTKMNQIIT